MYIILILKNLIKNLNIKLNDVFIKDAKNRFKNVKIKYSI